MTSAVVRYESRDQVQKDLDAMRVQVAEMLPARMDPDRFLRVVAKAVIESPRLMECTRVSLLAAIHEAAQLGLEPTGLLGSAYLVPYRVKREDGKYELRAQLIPGYRGLIDLARRSGTIAAIMAEVVHERDHFVLVRGTQPRLEHIPFVPNPREEPDLRDPGPVVGAYMVADLVGGGQQVEWMTWDAIEVVRKSSRAASQGPWVTNYEEMCRKTVVRRGAKYLPLSTEFRRALELDEEAERMAAPPPDSTQRLTPAQRLLQERALAQQGQGVAPSATEEGDGSQAAADEGSDEAEGVQDAQEPRCPGENPDLGKCTKAPGHKGAHGNEEGVWPQ